MLALLLALACAGCRSGNTDPADTDTAPSDGQPAAATAPTDPAPVQPHLTPGGVVTDTMLIGQPTDQDRVRIERIVMGNGLVIEDLRAGTGPDCLPGHTVLMHYRGYVWDADIAGRTPPNRVNPPQASEHTPAPEPPAGQWKEFDSTYWAGEPIDVAMDDLVAGLRLGIAGMRVGGTRRVTVPADLAFGSSEQVDEAGNVVIPANAVLMFEVDLLASRAK